MATTKESIVDGLVWVRELLGVWLRWGLVLGVVFGLFGLAMWATRGVDYGDCGDVTTAQRAVLESLREPEPDRGFVATESPSCIRGVYVSEVDGIDGDLADAVDELDGFGWRVERTFIPFFYDLYVQCLGLDETGWEEIELNISAGRDGTIARAEVRATEGRPACATLRCSSLSTGCDSFDLLERPE